MSTSLELRLELLVELLAELQVSLVMEQVLESVEQVNTSLERMSAKTFLVPGMWRMSQ